MWVCERRTFILTNTLQLMFKWETNLVFFDALTFVVCTPTEKSWLLQSYDLLTCASVCVVHKQVQPDLSKHSHHWSKWFKLAFQHLVNVNYVPPGQCQHFVSRKCPCCRWIAKGLRRSLQEFFVYTVFLSNLGGVVAHEWRNVHCAAMSKLFQSLALLYILSFQKHIETH